MYIGQRIIRVKRISGKTLVALQKRGFIVLIVGAGA